MRSFEHAGVRCWVHGEQDTEDGPVRKKEKGKTEKEVSGCGEGGYMGGWHDKDAEDGLTFMTFFVL